MLSLSFAYAIGEGFFFVCLLLSLSLLFACAVREGFSFGHCRFRALASPRAGEGAYTLVPLHSVFNGNMIILGPKGVVSRRPGSFHYRRSFGVRSIS